jgi:hypothetical protein
VLICGVEEHTFAGGLATHDEHVVLVRPHDNLVNFGICVGPVQGATCVRCHVSILAATARAIRPVLFGPWHDARRSSQPSAPASEDEATLEAMIEAGMDVARMALAHTPLDEALTRHQRVRDVAARMGRTVGTLVDLPGSKIRIGRVAVDGLDLEIGDTVKLVVGNEN